MMTVSKKIIVVIPAYNEEKTVGDVIRGVPKSLAPGYSQLILVIDDGSTDNTAEVARNSGAIVVQHGKKRGLGFAMRLAVKEALAAGADIIVSLDADGQHNPAEIPRLLKPILENKADFVVGKRPPEAFEGMPLIKRIGNALFSSILKSLVHITISDTQCGFRVMSSKLAESLMFYSSYTYTQETLIEAVEEGFRIAEVPISHRLRQHGPSRLIESTLRYGLRVAVIIFKIFRDYHPLLVFGSAGVLMILFGVGVGLHLLLRLTTLGYVEAPTSIMLFVFCIVGGLQIFFFGLLADMLRRKR